MEPSPPVVEAVHHVSRRRPWYRTAMHYVRRGHLYCGLFLLPWVALYGATAFLFNHPTAFSDQLAVSFDRESLADTPMASPPSPAEVAGKVVDALRAKGGAETSYAFVEPEKAKYTREFAFATVKAEGQDLNVLIDVTGAGGTIRGRPPATAPKVEEKAPFAIGGRGTGGPGGGGRGGRAGAPGGAKGGERGPRTDETLKIDDPLHERVKAAVPNVLAKAGVPTGEVTVTSVPDLSFRMRDKEKVWDVTYNAQTGSLSGKSADAEPATGDGLSTRRFLTRLHLAHGYPGEVNAKWAWAVIVDAMAFTMLFWALSGVFMWWQIKATRRIGAVVLLLSAGAALWVGFGMHEMLSAAQLRG